MKNLIFGVLFVTLVAIVHGSPQSRGINEQIVAFIEGVKKQMPCGFDEIGLPVLAPFSADRTEIQFEHFLATLLAAVNDLQVNGLNDFKVNAVDFNILQLKIYFDLHFNEIDVAEGQYLIKAALIYFLKINGSGDLDFKLQDLRVNGTIKLRIEGLGLAVNVFNLNVTLGNVKSNISGLLGGGLLGTWTNRLIEIFVKSFVNNQQEFIEQQAQDIIIPVANSLLDGLTLTDILGIINGNNIPGENCPPQAMFLM